VIVSSSDCALKSRFEFIQFDPLPRPAHLSWYAIRIKSKLGSLASATLRGKGYEEFLPMYRSRRRWSDRFKDLELPLFPGYLFCRFDVNDRLMPILTTPGVISILGAGKTPLPIDDDEIEAIKSGEGKHSNVFSSRANDEVPFAVHESASYVRQLPPQFESLW
jgi:transcription antitermination factor NusG